MVTLFIILSWSTSILMNAVMFKQGYILTSEIDGTIQMKSYLTGNPEIRLALNEDLAIGRGGRSLYGTTAKYLCGHFSKKTFLL